MKTFNKLSLIVGPILIASCIASLFINNYSSGRYRMGNEAAAIGTLRNYAECQHEFYAVRGVYGSIDDMVESGLMYPMWKNQSVHDSYKFSFQVTDQGKGYQATAEPVDKPSWIDGTANQRSFYLNNATGIHWAESCPALATDRRIGE